MSTTTELRALPASDLFGLADELAFRRQFVTQFLASYCAANFNDYCARGMQDLLETPPVEDADYLSFAAWKHWCATMKPNDEMTSPRITPIEPQKDAR
jgi:hypothetical protein